MLEVICCMFMLISPCLQVYCCWLLTSALVLIKEIHCSSSFNVIQHLRKYKFGYIVKKHRAYNRTFLKTLAVLQTMRRYGDEIFRSLVKCITNSIQNENIHTQFQLKLLWNILCLLNLPKLFLNPHHSSFTVPKLGFEQPTFLQITYKSLSIHFFSVLFQDLFCLIVTYQIINNLI